MANTRTFLGLTKTGFVGGIVALLLASVIVLGTFLAYEVGQNRKLAVRGAQAQTALCTLKADLVSRVGDERVALGRSQKFLLAHPQGIPGISAALIKQGITTQERTIAGQQATVAALGKTLPC